MRSRQYDPDHCTACGDFLPCGKSWIRTADEAYDRLHGLDGHTQADAAHNAKLNGDCIDCVVDALMGDKETCDECGHAKSKHRHDGCYFGGSKASCRCTFGGGR